MKTALLLPQIGTAGLCFMMRHSNVYHVIAH